MSQSNIYEEGSPVGTLGSRTKFKDYILRRLGYGVINVELSEEQINDIIDDAIDFYVERHYDGLETEIFVFPINGEVRRKGYFETPADFRGVSEVLVNRNPSGTTEGFDRLNYLIANSDILRQNSTLSGLQTYVTAYKNIAELRHFFTQFYDYDFNLSARRLHIRGGDLSSINEFVVLGYKSINRDLDLNLYSDQWLRNYATALARIQWGHNLFKYTGMQMPGGGEINADAILSEGKEERDRLLEEFELTYTQPALPLIE